MDRDVKPLRDDGESTKELAIRGMAAGWCPWPFRRGWNHAKLESTPRE